ncbi:fibronectin type III domain-containing protein, partial [Planctomycetota bacterium]
MSRADDQGLWAVTREGSTKWRFSAPIRVHGSAAVLNDGSVIVAARNHILYRVDGTGQEVWSAYPAPGSSRDYFSAPTVSSTDSIYIGRQLSGFFAFAADGGVDWTFQPSLTVRSTAAIGSSGEIVFGANDGYLYSIDANGGLQWRFSLGAAVEKSSPALAADGTIYMGTATDGLYAIAPDGGLKWHLSDVLGVYGTPAVTWRGDVVVSARDHTVHCIDSSGSTRWAFRCSVQSKQTVRSSPVVDAGGVVYASADSDTMFAIAPKGHELWRYQTGGPILAGAAIGANGALYFGSNDTYLYALGGIPAAPTNLNVTALSAFEVSLGWTDNAADETGFALWRSITGSSQWDQVATLGLNVTTFTDGTVAQGTAYSYVVRAVGPGGESPQSNLLEVVVPLDSAPNAPTGLTLVEAATNWVTLSWTDLSDDEEVFVIQRSPAPTAGFQTVAAKGANSTTFTDTLVAPRTVYYYRVRSYNAGGGGSAPSNVLEVVTPPSATPPPPAPSGLAAVAVGPKQVNLTWTDNASNETGFHIERRRQGAGDFAQIAALSTDATAFSDETVVPSAVYEYRVFATNSGGESPASNLASVTTPALPLPAAPTGLTITAANAARVVLSWTDNATYESAFRIERRIQGEAFGFLSSVAADITDYADTTVASDTAYEYYVVATNHTGDSQPSNLATATTPPAPKLTSASVDSGPLSGGTTVLLAGKGFRDHNAGQNTVTFGGVAATTFTVLSDTQISVVTPRGPEPGDVEVAVSNLNGRAVLPTTFHYQNHALYFDGGDAVNLSHNSSFNLGRTVTFECWLKLQSHDSGKIFSKWSLAIEDKNFQISGGKPNVYLAGPNGGLTAKDQLLLGKWTHVAVVLDTTGTRIYIDGRLNTQSGLAGDMKDASGTPRIGRYHRDNRWWDSINGYLDEFRLSRTARYTADFVPETRLRADQNTVVLFHFDEGEGASTTDASPNSNHGTLANSAERPLWVTEDFTYNPTPLPPSNLVATPLGPTWVELTWVDNADNEDGFRIERRLRHDSLPDGANASYCAATQNFYAFVPTTYSQRLDAKAAAATLVLFGQPGHLATVTSDAESAFLASIYGGKGWLGGGDTAEEGTWRWDTGPEAGLTFWIGGTSGGVGQTGYANWDTGQPDNSHNEDHLHVHGAHGRWNDASSVSMGYYVEFETGAIPNVTYEVVATLPANTTTLSDKSVDPDRSYQYRIVAFNQVGDSCYSNVAEATTPDGTPTAPTNLTATAVTGARIDLGWTDNAQDELGFRIERAVASPSGFTEVATTATDTTTFTDPSVSPGIAYYYRVAAYNALGPSLPSNTASATPPSGGPAAPTDLDIVSMTAFAVSIAWQDHADNEDGFAVYRSLLGSVQFDQIATMSLNVATFTDATVAQGTAYSYVVRAFGAGGTSAASNPLEVVVPLDSAPNAPTGLTLVQAATNSVTLSWTDLSDDEEGFTIRRSLAPTAGFQSVGTVAANLTTFTDATVAPESTYYYRVAAFNSVGGAGVPSSTVEVTTPRATIVFSQPVHVLRKPNPAASDNFGSSCSLAGKHALVGAYRDDTGAADAGAAYLFDAESGQLRQTLTNPTPASGDNFGYSVAVADGQLLVGARRDDAGAVDAGADVPPTRWHYSLAAKVL